MLERIPEEKLSIDEIRERLVELGVISKEVEIEIPETIVLGQE